MDTYLKKSVGRAGRGTPVTVLEHLSGEFYRCILNDKVRILFRDEISLSPQDEYTVIHDGVQGFPEGK